ncbi:MAG: PilN domain-containing protein [Thermodesulfovibrio sp.]|nr:PilN domain-containing protein [Thermodesulfovibrio sp.]MCX7724737.1 PilN domain-containing protein [Thermodesulfovibrio sp.]
MIKINLLSKKDIKKLNKRDQIQVLGEIVKRIWIPFIITVAIVLAIFAYFEYLKSEYQKEIEKQKQLLTSLQKKIAEIKRFEAMNKDIENKTKLIESFKKMQSAPVNILSTVVKKLPEGVWLTGLQFDDAVTVEGIGFSNLNVVAFVDNLKSTPELQDVYLVESQQTEFEKQSVYKFIVRFKLRV